MALLPLTAEEIRYLIGLDFGENTTYQIGNMADVAIYHLTYWCFNIPVHAIEIDGKISPVEIAAVLNENNLPQSSDRFMAKPLWVKEGIEKPLSIDDYSSVVVPIALWRKVEVIGRISLPKILVDDATLGINRNLIGFKWKVKIQSRRISPERFIDGYLHLFVNIID